MGKLQFLIVFFAIFISSSLCAQDSVTNSVLEKIKYRELVDVPGGTYIQERAVGYPRISGPIKYLNTVSDFQIAKYVVTYELWYAVYHWAISNGYTFANTGLEGIGSLGPQNSAQNKEKAPTQNRYMPVSQINWRDAIIWCNAYSEMSGLSPVYYVDDMKKIPIKKSTNSNLRDSTNGSVDNPYVNWISNGYRLPTEGEWQYSASYINGKDWTPCNFSSGATTYFNDIRDVNPSNGVPDGKDTNDIVAFYHVYWNGKDYVSNGLSASILPVGTKQPNNLGIFDMSGNIGQWCWDWLGEYPSENKTNYRGIEIGNTRVRRGGDGYANWGNDCLQIGWRDGLEPWAIGNKNGFIGFRVAKTQ